MAGWVVSNANYGFSGEAAVNAEKAGCLGARLGEVISDHEDWAERPLEELGAPVYIGDRDAAGGCVLRFACSQEGCAASLAISDRGEVPEDQPVHVAYAHEIDGLLQACIEIDLPREPRSPFR